MKRFLRQCVSVLSVLVLSASLLPMEDAYAGGGRGGGGGASRSGGFSRSGGSRGGGASPRVNTNVSTQNRGNFKNYSQPSYNRPQGQQNRQSNVQNRQGERQTTQQNRQGERQTTQQNRQGERQTAQQNRQGERTERTDTRQGERTDRQDNRQEGFTDRQNNRQDFIDDNYGDRWYGGGWYGGGYYVPPGWGWVGLTTGLVIGSAIANPPPYYDTVYVGSTSYIYSDGIYMQPSGSEYTVVAPPVGAVVNYLPDGCSSSQVNDVVIYNCSGIYYQPFFQNGSTVYQVVQL